MMPFAFTSMEPMREVLLVEPKAFRDERGWFADVYKKSTFNDSGIRHEFVQDSHSFSRTMGIVRGLHYQKNPATQGKLVRCIEGSIFDVAVDIRKGSPTYARWVSADLTAENRRMLWIPPGFAHGFCTTSPVSEVVYKMTSEYSPNHERGVRWDDPTIGVPWPVAKPILSPKDAGAPLLKDADNDFTWSRHGQG